MDKVTLDIESLVGDKLHPYQITMLDKMSGFRKGEMMIMSAGRQLGKSLLNGQALQRVMDDIMERPVEDLKLSQGTVYGARYYTVEPIGGNWKDMEEWCGQTFGDPGDRIWDSGPAPLPAKRWYMNNRKFWFRHEKDRDWFILKWRS